MSRAVGGSARAKAVEKIENFCYTNSRKKEKTKGGHNNDDRSRIGNLSRMCRSQPL